MYNDDNDDIRLGRKSCSDRDDSFNYNITDAGI